MTKNYDNKEKRFVTFAKEQPGHAEKANKIPKNEKVVRHSPQNALYNITLKVCLL